MKIDVKKVASLSNLKLSQEEENEFDKQLSDIVGYIEKLNTINTTDIEPTAQVTGLVNSTRNDSQPHNSLPQEVAISGGEKVHNALFVVEKLVDTT